MENHGVLVFASAALYHAAASLSSLFSYSFRPIPRLPTTLAHPCAVAFRQSVVMARDVLQCDML